MQSNNKSVMFANLRMLEFVAMKLGEIRDDGRINIVEQKIKDIISR